MPGLGTEIVILRIVVILLDQVVTTPRQPPRKDSSSRGNNHASILNTHLGIIYTPTCVASPKQNKQKKPTLPTNPRLETPPPPFFYIRRFGIPPEPQPHLSSECLPPPCDRLFGALIALWQSVVSVSYRHRNFAGKVGKYGSRSLHLFFLV